MNMDSDKLNVLREISNIGSGNASTSLALMLNEMVDIGIPTSKMINFLDITNNYNSPEELVAGTVLQITDDMEGFIMVIMKTDSALNLLSKVSGKSICCNQNDYNVVCKELNPMGEICNILCGTYLTAISDMTGLKIKPSVPYFSVDKIMSVMNLPKSLSESEGESILSIETDFFTEDKRIEGKYYFIPKLESCNKLLESLGFSN